MRKRHERRSREQWSAIIEDQATSGLSIADYCQSNNIGLASFAKWKRRLRDDTTKPGHSKQSAESCLSKADRPQRVAGHSNIINRYEYHTHD